MQVKTLKVTNFKGIEKAELNLNEKVNLFVGSNGAGKTTILEAIFSCITFIPRQFGWLDKIELEERNISYNKEYFILNSKVGLPSLVSDKQDNNLCISVGLGEVPEGEAAIIKRQFIENVQNLPDRIEVINRKKNYPIIKFFPANRSPIKGYEIPPSKNKKERLRLPEAWLNPIHDEFSYADFSDWFIEKETQELREQRDAKDLNKKLPELEAVRMAISEAFFNLYGKNFILKSTERPSRISSPVSSVLLLEDFDTEERVFLEDKSDGEKTIIAFIGEIAYTLALANPKNRNNANYGTGIVLIDEIEAHLHPNWQREIIPILTRTFPNLQFFFTTHSPQVVSSVDSENVFVCEDFQFSKINIKSKGVDTNTLLSHVFGATERPREYLKLIEEIDILMEAQEDPDKIKSIIDQIRSLYQRDNKTDVSLLMTELEMRLESYKFDLEHEAH